MKRKVGIVIDSTTGFKVKEEMFNDCTVVPLSIIVDGEAYVDGTLTNEELLKLIDAKKKVTTSQPTVSMFADAFNEQFDLGYEEIVCFTIGTGLSGTLNGAISAKGMFEDKVIHVVDTMTVGPGVEFLIGEFKKYIESGMNTQDALDKLMNEQSPLGDLILSVDDLDQMVKGGRLSRINALIGNILKIKPILSFKENKLEVVKKARGKEGVYKFILDSIKGKMINGFKTIVNIAYVDDKEPALDVYNKLKEDGSIGMDNVSIFGKISAVIATHIGPRGIGVYFNFVKVSE